MRWTSTIQSADSGEITVTAILETVLSVTVMTWLAIRVFESWLPVVIACSIAPILLLRTDISTDRAIKWNDLLGEILNKVVPDNRYFLIVAAIPILIICTLVIPLIARIVATLVSFVQRPLYSLAAIPRNWMRITLCTDFFHLPELIPGMEASEELSPLYSTELRVTALVKDFRQNTDIGVNVLNILILTFVYAFALPYRYSLKSTAIVWMPLLWVIPTATTSIPLKARLRLINQSSWGRFVTLASVSIVLLFVGKLLLFNIFVDLIAWWQQLNVIPIFEQVVSPFTVPVWQLASVTNAIIAIAMYFFASHILILQDESSSSYEGGAMDYMFRYTSVIRTILSLYTIACLSYILVSQLPEVNWPPIGDRLFPWS